MLELISFDLCPFVQRSVITLLKKNVEHKITYIDLSNKPDWFLKVSPLGKVPALNIDGEVLFESAVINEYLDEVTEGSLLPLDSLAKARCRAWIEFASQLLQSQYRLSTARTKDDFEKELSGYKNLFQRLELDFKGSEYFLDEFSLVDSSFAPAFTRQLILEQSFTLNVLDEFPRIKKWALHLNKMDAVQNSVIKDFNEKYINYLKANGSYICSYQS